MELELETVLNLLECPVCLLPPRDTPIFQCSTGETTTRVVHSRSEILENLLILLPKGHSQRQEIPILGGFWCLDLVFMDQ